MRKINYNKVYLNIKCQFFSCLHCFLNAFLRESKSIWNWPIHFSQELWRKDSFFGKNAHWSTTYISPTKKILFYSILLKLLIELKISWRSSQLNFSAFLSLLNFCAFFGVCATAHFISCFWRMFCIKLTRTGLTFNNTKKKSFPVFAQLFRPFSLL